MAPETIAVIPARGGSKRIPFKNGRDFCGRPMMEWPILRAKQSGIFDRIVVSTDDDRLAQIAVEAGAEVPFLREPALADDYTGATEVIRDAARRLKLAGESILACIYPTAVFALETDMITARDKLLAAERDWVFTVGEFRAPILRSYGLTAEGLKPNWPEHMTARSQDLAPAYFDAGQVYFARAGTWQAEGAFPWNGADAVVLPAERCIDIDAPEDLDFAEQQFQRLFQS
ncbi:MAG: pseudaminic acid cytidylyltransferase [Rhodobacteraceae bacterium]|nr:pseudaminic acid cytidylyltransferase [Paracoccaceae bacterium]